MKNILKVAGLSALLLSANVMAEEKVSAISKADGFYLGAGGGTTFGLSFLSIGNYQDNTSTYDTGYLGDSSFGYIFYGGYQFNKIIAIEAAYTDYGSFSDNLRDTTTDRDVKVSTDPTSMSVYANAGYTFANGLRPFGQIGLGYMQINGSTLADNIGLDDSMTMRFGLGLEYAPSNLVGFGFRVAYVEDVAMDMSYSSDNNGNDTSTLLMNVNGMLYVGAQYKF